jgi:hypothetical protein
MIKLRKTTYPVLCLSLILFNALPVQAAAPKLSWGRGIQGTYSVPIFEKLSDPLSAEMSPEAEQMSDLLGITKKLERLMTLVKQAQSGSLTHADREEMVDIRFEILETVEETRLQIDFIAAEIEEERVILEEARDKFSEDRDNRVNKANLLAFRTNGVLWALAEALDIPTYKNPRLSIPSGTIGILAGIVPSLFSGYATRASGGGRYLRQVYPNILTKIYDFPTIPRVEYPEIVWQYLNSKPCGETRTRRQIMQDRWRDDKNIHALVGGVDAHKLKLLTGNEPYIADLELISDKLIMMGQVKAVTLQMARPLLEICMAARGKKHFVGAAIQ